MSIAFKILKRVIAGLFSLAVFAVIGFLLWRILSSGDPKSMKTIDVNDDLYAAYEQKGEDLYVFKQEQRSITSGDRSYGYFSITDYEIIPDADQIQAVVRYNNSTLEATAQDYALGKALEREYDWYDVTLLIAIDLTPDDKSDNSGNDEGSVKFIRCHGRTVLSDTKNMYNYRKMVFDLADADVDISALIDKGLLLAIYADFYYVEDINYDEEPYGALCLYDYKSVNMVVKLESRDIKALEKYKQD
jgi:hypothetical protein